MSLNAIYEVLIYLDTFRNVELRDQGQYFLAFELFNDSMAEIDYARPYHHFEVNTELKCRKRNKISGQPGLSQAAYQTKQFRIKFSDEEIDLKEVVVFRAQLPTFPRILSAKLSIKLVFVQEDNQEEIDEAVYLLNFGEMPMVQYSDVLFRKFKSTLSLCVFSLMIDYKFRLFHSSGVSNSALNKRRQKVSSLDSYFEFYKKENGRTESHLYRDYVKPLRVYSQKAKMLWGGMIRDQQLRYQFGLPAYCLGDTDSLELVKVDEKKFFQYANMFKTDKFTSAFFRDEVQSICTESYSYLQQFMLKIRGGYLDVMALRDKHRQHVKERFAQFIVRSSSSCEQVICDKFKGKEKEVLASVFRKNKLYNKELGSMIDLNEKDLTDKPIVFHEITSVENTSSFIDPSHKNLLVYCHGLGGKAFDMMSIRNLFKTLCPSGLSLMCKANQDKTEGNIRSMGERVAVEIIDYIDMHHIKDSVVIHFIGHSMGGVILRAALPYLHHFKNQFGLYVSFSVPHLSYLKEISSSIQAGIWFLKKLRKSTSISQLTMDDHTVPRKCFMYELSKTGSLKNFSKIVLVSSFQDKYVPWHSARIHQSGKKSIDVMGELQNEMIANILSGDTIQDIHRIQVSLSISQKNFDSYIGRAAHIKLLSDENTLKLIRYCIEDVFA